jgi:hypothetical protein
VRDVTTECRYGFSSEQAAQEFAQRPAAYIAAAKELLLRHPHLIPTVAGNDTSVPRLLVDVLSMGFSILCLDCGTQTPTHFIEEHIDSRYSPKLYHSSHRPTDSMRGGCVMSRYCIRLRVSAATSGMSGLCEGRLLLLPICRQRQLAAARLCPRHSAETMKHNIGSPRLHRRKPHSTKASACQRSSSMFQGCEVIPCR